MTNLAQTITATISPDAINKTTRFYNASLKDIIIELFQNARRANATHIIAKIYNTKLIIEDNGHGIKNPQDILSFGKSQWNENKAQNEDAAGMGFFSLSNRNVKISSKTQDMNTGWSAKLTPEVFKGNSFTQVKPSQIKIGTRVSFNNKYSINEIKDLDKCAKYIGIPVAIIDMRGLRSSRSYAITPTKFLEDSLETKENSYGIFGIYKAKWLFNKDNVNFYGCTITTPLPIIGGYCIKLDIKDTHKIKLVLPSRKEIIRDQNWKNLYQEAVRYLYQYISKQKGHNLSFQKYEEAKSLGVILKEARPILTYWTPEYAEPNDNECNPIIDINKRKSPIIKKSANAPIEDQLLNIALKTPISKSQHEWDYSIYEANRDMIGYSWYDDIPHIKSLKFVITKLKSIATINNLSDGIAIIKNQEYQIGIWLKDFEDPDKIEIHITLTNDKKIKLDIGIILIGEDERPDCINIIATKQKKKTINSTQLARLIKSAYFKYEENYDSDSWETQERHFKLEAKKAAITFLDNKISAAEHDIFETILSQIKYKIPTGYTLKIKANLNQGHTNEDSIFVNITPKMEA